MTLTARSGAGSCGTESEMVLMGGRFLFRFVAVLLFIGTLVIPSAMTAMHGTDTEIHFVKAAKSVHAFAECSSPVDPNISISSSQGPPGTVVTVRGSSPAGNKIIIEGLTTALKRFRMAHTRHN
jgi:hypothetical protein